MTPRQPVHRTVFGLFLALGMVAGCDGVKAQPAQADSGGDNAPPFAKAQSIEIPRGSAIFVRLQEPISSATATEGQTFIAVLDEPLAVDGETVAPQGASVSGRVVAARQSGHLHDAGYLRLTLSSVTVGGKVMPVQTSSIFVKGGSFHNRNLAYVGGGTGGGALLGAIVGGGKGALIGGTLGAAGGTTAAYATGKNEVGFSAESRLGFRLIEPVQVER